MTAAASPVLLPEQDLQLRRWVVAAAAVAAAHAGLLLWLMRKHDVTAPGSPAAAVLIDLPPMEAPSPATAQPLVIEGPQLKEAGPAAAPALRPAPPAPGLAPVQKPAAGLMSKPRPKPETSLKAAPEPAVKPAKEPRAPRTGAPKQAGRARASAPQAPAPRQASAGSAAAAASWRAQIFAHLVQFKPTGAGTTGSVSVSFTIARSGRLLSARLISSSGSSLLDEKALEMVRRANPFPAAPGDVAGASFPFVVPVRFH